MSVDWGYYNKFDDVMKKYLPPTGEGETLATQTVTAVTKLVHKWYNDGDVYDNVNSEMQGWANDLSSYANWLRKYSRVNIAPYLDRIYDCYTESDYEDLLKNVTDILFRPSYLESLSDEIREGSIYDCSGPYKFEEYYEDEEDDEYYDMPYGMDDEEYEEDYY